MIYLYYYHNAGLTRRQLTQRARGDLEDPTAFPERAV